jgi:hypothetical protein
MSNRQFQNFCEYALKSNCLIVNYINYTIKQLPKFFPTEKTFLNADIKCNMNKSLAGLVQLKR